MSNRIKVSRDVHSVELRHISVGGMFRYPDSSNPENVYMRVADSNGYRAINLRTGQTYSVMSDSRVMPFAADTEVTIVQGSIDTYVGP